MSWIKIILVCFIFLETSNILVLYFLPDSKMANGMGAFKAWERSKGDPGLHDLIRYLVNWVAGTKLIFVGLLLVIIFTADRLTTILAAGVMALTISAFYWRLFPLIRAMDREGQIDPPAYSKTLGWLIAGMVGMFLAAILLTVI